MEGYLLEWLNLLVRWAHVVVGIAWIGASLYFIWLDNHLEPSKDPQLAGELWAIHGGGFYNARKFKLGPDQLPATLHWFKWEAYWTWITGFALLVLMYYVNAELYLIDPGVMALSKPAAIAIGLGVMVGGYAIYEGLCRSPLAMGLLGGRYTATSTRPADDVRGRQPEWLRWFADGRPNPEFLERIDTVRAILTADGRTLAQARSPGSGRTTSGPCRSRDSATARRSMTTPAPCASVRSPPTSTTRSSGRWVADAPVVGCRRGHRSGRKKDRSSSTKTAGCSNAAKWPPLSSSCHCRMSV